MKKFLFLLITIAPLFVSGQWVFTNIDGYASAASFLNQDSFLVNIGNSLYKTGNGGQTFDKINNFPFGSSYNTWYKSSDTFFATQPGIKGILQSTDAGDTWVTQTFLMPNGDTAFKKSPPFFFGFFDQNHGIVIGDTFNGIRQVFLSNNGGVTWNFYQHPSIDSIHFRMVNQVRKNPYINDLGNLRLIIDAKMLFITDYGRLWSLGNISTTGLISDFAFKDNDTGFAFIHESGTPDFFKTTDGGKNWVMNPRDTSYKLESGRLFYVKGDGVHRPFILSPTLNVSGLTNVSYDEGYSWQRFDTLTHQFVAFYNSACGISDFYEPGVASQILLYDKSYTGLKNIQTLIHPQLVMYPNPTSDILSFSEIFRSIELWDTQGKLAGSFNETSTIDVSAFQNGLYWIKATDSRAIQYTQKLLIQH